MKRMIWRLTCSEKARGRRMRCIRASSGVRLPFWWLQRLQHATRLSHVLSPPRERGKTWSSVSSEGGKEDERELAEKRREQLRDPELAREEELASADRRTAGKS